MEKYNSVVKVDANGEIYQRVVFNMPVIQLGAKRPQKINKTLSESLSPEEVRERAQRRAKTKVKDYIRTNTDLKYFVTYTLSPEKVKDRYDEKLVYSSIRNWLSDRVKLKGLKYILVPELHEDNAWHFHGFTNKNLKWNYGISVVKYPRSERASKNAINYTVSYIGKDDNKFNGRYYLHSNNLKEPTKIYDNTDFDQEDGYCFEIKNGLLVKIID